MFTVLQHIETKKSYAKILELYRNNAPIQTIISEMLKCDILVLPMRELTALTKREMPGASTVEIERAVATKVRYISRCYYKHTCI